MEIKLRDPEMEKKVEKLLKDKNLNYLLFTIGTKRIKGDDYVINFIDGQFNCMCDICIDQMIASLEKTKLQLIGMQTQMKMKKLGKGGEPDLSYIG